VEILSDMIAKPIKSTVCDYLKGFKAQLVAQGGLCLARRKQNLDSLASLGLTIADFEGVILDLTEENYCEGPKLARENDRAGVWFITDLDNGQRVYLELMLDAYSAKCLSLHAAGRLRAVTKR
jgi:hypothetical protein